MESKIISYGFVYEYVLENNEFYIEAIHNLSKRFWSRKLDILPWKMGCDLSINQINLAFQNKSLILPHELPPPRYNLILQLEFDLLGEEFIVDLALFEEEIDEIDRFKLIIADLREEIRNLRNKLDSKIEAIIRAAGRGDLFFDLEDENHVLKLRPHIINPDHLTHDFIQ